jgi:hypothetical protein
MLKVWGTARVILASRPNLHRWMSVAVNTSASGMQINEARTSLDPPQLRSMRLKLRELSSEYEKSQLIIKEFKSKVDKKTPNSKAAESIIEQLVSHLNVIKRKFPESSLSSEYASVLQLLDSLDLETFDKLKPEVSGEFLLLVLTDGSSAMINDAAAEQLSSFANKALKRLLTKKAEPSILKLLSKLTSSAELFERCRISGWVALETIETIIKENSKLKIDLENLLYRFITSQPAFSSAEIHKLRSVLDAHLLRYAWSERLAALLFHRGLMSFRLFKYWLIEVYKFTPDTALQSLTSDQKLNLGLDGPQNFGDLLHLNGLYFLTFTDLPKELLLMLNKKASEAGSWSPWQSRVLGTPLLSTGFHSSVINTATERFNSLLHGKYGPTVYENRIKQGLDTTTMKAEILLLQCNNPKGEFIQTMKLPDLLGLIHTSVELLGCREAKQYWVRHAELLKKRTESMHEDFGAILEGSYILFSSTFLIRTIYPEYLKSLQKFLDSQLAPQHFEDAKYRAWKRGFSEVAYLSDTLLALADKIGGETDTSEFIGHQMHVSKIISDALIDPIMHPEFENDLDRFYVLNADDEKIADPAQREPINGRMSESARNRKAQVTPTGKKAEAEFKTRPTDLLETETLWREFERIVKVNDSFLANWDDTTFTVFTTTMKRMVKSGMATKKFMIAGIRVFEWFLPKMNALDLITIIRLLTDTNFLTESMKEKLESHLKAKLKSEIAPQLQKTLTKPEYFEALIDLSYMCALNKFYNQEMWNSLIYALDITSLEATLPELSDVTQIKLAHVVLLTRMEASYIRTATLDRLMPYLTSLSQLNYDVFKVTKFSEDVGQLLHKYYYDYLKKNEVAELIKVHYLQEKHVILCLDHEHFLLNSGIVKGKVATSIRLLKGLGFEIHIISRRRYNYDEKRSIRLDYLRENLKGVMFNEKRKLEVETTPAHGY